MKIADSPPAMVPMVFAPANVVRDQPNSSVMGLMKTPRFGLNCPDIAKPAAAMTATITQP